MPDRRVIDNHSSKAHDFLRRMLGTAKSLRVVSAYFSIYGFELLAEQLEGLRHVRFLFGDPRSVEDVDPGAQSSKYYELTESGLSPAVILRQKPLAQRCQAWIQRRSVEVRSMRQSNFLHGKMYLADGEASSALTGSSNFTLRGLGGGQQPNVEINLATEDPPTLEELGNWFDALWHNPDRSENAKQKVLDALARIGKDYSPEALYFKTLYELFRDELERRQEGDAAAQAAGLTDSQIWNMLYGFQQDGARSVISKLNAHQGCILADSVGLGKTYTALAVIKHFELANQRVLVLCPKRLTNNWSVYQAANNNKHNPFDKDQFGYTLLAHTDLSRDKGSSGGVDLGQFNWGNSDLVVIDESHNFRNHAGQRYMRLLDEVIKAGAKTKVLMLSATPVNTSLIDLRNQIHLMTEGRDGDFVESLNVRSVGITLASAQKAFRSWEKADPPAHGKRDKAELVDSLGSDFLRLLDGLSISRSRRQIEEFYSADMVRVGQFPHRSQPVNKHPPTDLKGQLSYEQLAERIKEFSLAVYQPSAYVVDEERKAELEREKKVLNFNQKDREGFLVGMMRVNFLKRLESSPEALRLTLDRTIGKIRVLLEKIARFQSAQSETVRLTDDDVTPGLDEDDDEFAINRSRNPYRLQELDLARWRADLRNDRDTLQSARDQVALVTPGRDGKLQALSEAIANKAGSPTRNLDGRANRKLLVFTTFKDTALYLFEQLEDLANETGVNMALVCGDLCRSTNGLANFDAILSAFAPKARRRNESSEQADIDLLLATDCISEGQNLQDCDTVLNYDIHWNPVRLLQRLGRIDRIGSQSETIRMINFWPTTDMDAYLRLKSRVEARMALANMAATGDEDLLDEENAQIEINFRDQQLRRLREEMIDLEELDDSPALGDFTLDSFLAQLLTFLQRNKDMLEKMPMGAYAVVEVRDSELPPGVIFCLQQRNSGAESAKRPASAVHPHYLVYVGKNGDIRYGCGSARRILGAFHAAASGKSEPIKALCDRFDQETGHGRAMAAYDDLLNKCIGQIVQAGAASQASGLGLKGDAAFKLPRVSEVARTRADFELKSWLVIQERA